MEKRRGLKLIAIFSALAILVSVYLAYQHFSTEPSKWCNIGASFSCDIVNKSEFSTVDGVFNLFLKSSTVIKIIQYLMILSIIYAAFLIYIEAEVLQSWCIFCLLLDLIILIITYIIFAIKEE